MQKYLLEIIVFVTGFVIIVLELVGSRLFAPYLGASLYTWTSLIGVILAGLSIGYWWGGRIADRDSNTRTLGKILFFSSVYILAIAAFQASILELIQTVIWDIRVAATVAAIVLFALPSVLLGMVSPYAVRLKMKTVAHSGETVGRLYAISTVGSIVGSFATGFFLIAYLGSTKILFILSAILFLASLFVYRHDRIKRGLLFSLIGVGVFFPLHTQEQLKRTHETIDVDTRYNRVLIFTENIPNTNQRVRTMQINKETSSAMFTESTDLVFPYTKFYDLAFHFRPDVTHALMLGGGGYTYPAYFIERYPDAMMDVVEIDPDLLALARRYFRVPEMPRLRIFHEDARVFLNKKRAERYDAIFGDAYASLHALPYQLTTIEAVRAMYQLLTPNGVVVVNIISSIDGKKGEFLRAEYATFRQVFPFVYLFPVASPSNVKQVQNIMLVAVKSSGPPSLQSTNPVFSSFLSHRWEKDVPFDMPILTDDYAPVDQYMAHILSEVKKGSNLYIQR